MNDAQLFQQAGTMFIAGTWCKGTDSSPGRSTSFPALSWVLWSVRRRSRSMPQWRLLAIPLKR